MNGRRREALLWSLDLRGPDALAYEIRLRERVTIALQEKHRYLDSEQMPSPKDGRLPCGMQWEAEKGDATYVWQWRLCLRLRCHAATK